MTRKILLSLCLSLLILPLAAQDFDPEAFDAKVQKAFQTLETKGLALAVVYRGEVVYKKAFGTADTQSNEKLSPEHLFNIASCSKAFTTAALSILVDQGKISWDDRVREHIPEFELADDYITQNMTLRDMLSHRTGLATFYGDLLWYNTDYDNAEVLRRMQKLPILNDFREDFGYQNNTYMLGGEIIRRKTGMSWSEFIQKHFFEELNMKNTLPSDDELTDKDKIAHPHYQGEKIAVQDFKATKPAASVFSSVDDMTGWLRMLSLYGEYKGKRILSESQLSEMWSPHTITSVGSMMRKAGVNFKTYGLGWYLFDFHGEKVAEHDGGMPGYISKVTVVPDRQLGLVVLNNGFDFFINDAVRYTLLDMLFNPESRTDWAAFYDRAKTGYESYMKATEEKRLKSRVEGTSPNLPLKDFSGSFEDQMYGNAEVSLKDGKLFLDLKPSKGIFSGELEHWHYNTFKVVFKDKFLTFGLITFEQDAQGYVTGFKVDLPSNDFHFHNLDFRKK